MRNLLTMFFAACLFYVFMTVSASTFLYVRTGRSLLSMLSAEALATCAAATILGFTLLIVITDRWTLRLAGKVSARISTRYGLAFALATFGFGLVCFVPAAIERYPLGIVAATMLTTVASGFLAGFLRGWMIDRMMGGDAIGDDAFWHAV